MVRKKIAAGGSAADPPHLGHLFLINLLLDCGKFDTVIWVLSGNREDKSYNVTPDDRVAMTELLLGPYRRMKDAELIIRYNDVYYENTPTWNCIQNLKEEFPEAEITWFTGSDSVIPRYEGKCEIEAKWDNGELLMKEANFLIIPREGFGRPKNLPQNFEISDYSLPNISSSKIRELINKKESIRDFTSSAVVDYIRTHKLYGSEEIV